MINFANLMGTGTNPANASGNTGSGTSATNNGTSSGTPNGTTSLTGSYIPGVDMTNGKGTSLTQDQNSSYVLGRTMGSDGQVHNVLVDPNQTNGAGGFKVVQDNGVSSSQAPVDFSHGVSVLSSAQQQTASSPAGDTSSDNTIASSGNANGANGNAADSIPVMPAYLQNYDQPLPGAGSSAGYTAAGQPADTNAGNIFDQYLSGFEKYFGFGLGAYDSGNSGVTSLPASATGTTTMAGNTDPSASGNSGTTDANTAFDYGLAPGSSTNPTSASDTPYISNIPGAAGIDTVDPRLTDPNYNPGGASSDANSAPQYAYNPASNLWQDQFGNSYNSNPSIPSLPAGYDWSGAQGDPSLPVTSPASTPMTAANTAGNAGYPLSSGNGGTADNTGTADNSFGFQLTPNSSGNRGTTDSSGGTSTPTDLTSAFGFGLPSSSGNSGATDTSGGTNIPTDLTSAFGFGLPSSSGNSGTTDSSFGFQLSPNASGNSGTSDAFGNLPADFGFGIGANTGPANNGAGNSASFPDIMNVVSDPFTTIGNGTWNTGGLFNGFSGAGTDPNGGAQQGSLTDFLNSFPQGDAIAGAGDPSLTDTAMPSGYNWGTNGGDPSLPIANPVWNTAANTGSADSSGAPYISDVPGAAGIDTVDPLLADPNYNPLASANSDSSGNAGTTDSNGASSTALPSGYDWSGTAGDPSLAPTTPSWASGNSGAADASAQNAPVTPQTQIDAGNVASADPYASGSGTPAAATADMNAGSAAQSPASGMESGAASALPLAANTGDAAGSQMAANEPSAASAAPEYAGMGAAGMGGFGMGFVVLKPTASATTTTPSSGDPAIKAAWDSLDTRLNSHLATADAGGLAGNLQTDAQPASGSAQLGANSGNTSQHPLSGSNLIQHLV